MVRRSVDIVSVDVVVPPEERVTDVGFNVTDGGSTDTRPVGCTEAVRTTFPLNPFRLVRAIVDVPCEPAGMVIDVELAETLKSGGGLMVKESVALWASDPLVPVTVTV